MKYWKMYRIGILILSLIYVTSAAHHKAIAVLENKEQGIYGKVTFEETDHGILIQGEIKGLKEGKHGFHIHEKGDISDAKCASAGGHFNPFNKHHGAPEDQDRHVGDLGNIIADKSGIAIFSIADKFVALSGPTCVIGRAVVLHENEDDLGRGGFSDSLTTGHAGGRLACGVIGRA
ncbi:superoxide dismutase [Cu-Zn]-like isoform X3 [Harmonia axyridis]|uniref:superoxide dismutase [Cu-Zn]-like isoform X3 n=1 Tax=Harmonia axyridis TaxID=115357 RepID=UPI001E277BA9|nr:superoxide dismutase [Cu-Zn]-like isoform X3 [Harmonia axyridis]